MSRVVQFTLEELKEKVSNYFIHCDNTEEPYTVTGLCLFLGVSRQTLINYENENRTFINMSEDEIREFVDTVKMAKLRIENYAERQLFNAKNPAGIIFNLKNNFNWVDKQEISSTIEQKTNPLEQLSKEELLKLAYPEEE